MARDDMQTVPQPVTEPAQDVALPAPRPPVLDSAGQGVAPPEPRPVREPVARDTAKPVHGSRAGWIVSIVVAAAASSGGRLGRGGVLGVARDDARVLSRTHRKRGAGLGARSPIS